MNIFVERFFNGPSFTIGSLYLSTAQDYQWNCFTLEDPHHEPKIPGHTRIPEGTYEVALRPEGGKYAQYYKRFGDWQKPGMLWIRNVPNFEWILIHPGNSSKDTEGCLLVGLGADTAAGVLTSSVDAYKALYATISERLVGGEGVKITYSDVGPSCG